MPREWDAKTYDSLPLPHQQWGKRTLGRLHLTGGETVLDAGCGTGRDTAALLDLVPDGRVIGVDGSRRMLDQLRTKLADRTDRIEVVHADLTRPLPVSGQVDAITSVATFHWITDHAALFTNLARHLRPGGQFVAECGGQGNVARINAAVDEVLGKKADGMDDKDRVWYFAGVEETTERLQDAGFTGIEVSLLPDPARLEPGEQLWSYLATVVLGSHLDKLPESEHERFVRDVAARLPEPVVDYVRLNITARRA
ncbi:class I SAM-dependent methyltransferase [Streptomyces sp. DSM 41527]|uniref:Class I SAM-dependent methyltransferase n=1 Tax=Streptomyces mooreae TaxID=3075523 RepID=A0ABU2TFP2_9ACTN|nr:class I SAM-dependent methyltransferase [Streptomyces sp. DSM 41527]MDT0459748.1 class I SAM-dependent methyltransferase [Streptomyces sp. DSM 41527]